MQRQPILDSTRQYINSINVARGYDQHFAGDLLFEYDSAMLHKWFASPVRIIDLGCGTGRHLLQFARKGCEVIGVDLSAEMLAQANAKLKTYALRGRLILGDLNELDRLTENPVNGTPLKECCDAAICMFSTLGLICGHENRVQFLRQVHKVLKPGGELAIHVHNYGYNIWRHEGRIFLLSNLLRKMLGKDQLGDKYLNYYRGIRRMYVHVFRRSEIIQILIDSGFKVEELIALNPSRTGPLKSSKLTAVLANGFLIRARRQ